VHLKTTLAALTLVSLVGCSDAGAHRSRSGSASPSSRAAAPRSSAAAPEAPEAPAPTWDPASTYAIVVGVLKFQSPKISGFSNKHRKDDELAKLLLARGVPKDHLVELLDEQATAENVFAAVEKMAKSAPKGATLLFYYAGHGGNGKAGEVSFVAYDADGTKATSIALDRVEKTIAKSFAGGKVLLFADCCYSGGLLEVAKSLEKKGFEAAAVTSAEASNLSSGNWTFSQSLIDAIDGDGMTDHDKSGTISLGELGEEVRQAMKNRERQRMGAEYGRLSPRFVLASDNPKRPSAPGADREYVRAKRGETWSVARVVGAKGDDLTVEFYDYSDKSRLDVKRAETQPIEWKNYKAAEKIEVLWEKKWWPAEVQKTDGDFHFITYTGFEHYWDEWVLSDRIQKN